MRFHNVTAVQERHFAVRFNPHFVAGMFGKNWEGGDVETKLSRLREFAYIFVRCVLLPNTRKMYLSKFPRTAVYLLRLRSRDSQGKVEHSSSVIDEVEKRIGLR
jgi:ribosome biogenesis protein Nip4